MHRLIMIVYLICRLCLPQLMYIHMKLINFSMDLHSFRLCARDNGERGMLKLWCMTVRLQKWSHQSSGVSLHDVYLSRNSLLTPPSLSLNSHSEGVQPVTDERGAHCMPPPDGHDARVSTPWTVVQTVGAGWVWPVARLTPEWLWCLQLSSVSVIQDGLQIGCGYFVN